MSKSGLEINGIPKRGRKRLWDIVLRKKMVKCLMIGVKILSPQWLLTI